VQQVPYFSSRRGNSSIEPMMMSNDVAYVAANAAVEVLAYLNCGQAQ
jgi:hypothetical protein